MSVALANIVDKDRLREVVNSFDFKQGILQSAPQIYVGEIAELKKELDGEIEPDDFEGGRLFSAKLEIRWRKKEKNKFYTLLISEEDISLEGYEKKDLMMTSYLSFYLWGEKDGNFWYELRIPKGWKYPVERRRAKIKAVECEVKGKPSEGKFYRFYSFEGVDQ